MSNVVWSTYYQYLQQGGQKTQTKPKTQMTTKRGQLKCTTPLNVSNVK